MSDLRDDFIAYRAHSKELRNKRFDKWLPLIKKAGAKELIMGVWRIGDWDLYPYKSGARNYKTGKRCYIGDIF